MTRLLAALIVLGIALLVVGARTVAPSAGAQGEQAVTAAPTVTTSDAQGMLRVNGRRFFPIGVTMPPPLGSTTPWGTDALDELANGGVTLFRTGPHGTPWTKRILQDAVDWSEAAAAHGVYTWVHLRELAEARPGTPEEAQLLQIVNALKGSAGTGLWKGADEPWPRYRPADLAHAYRLVKTADPNHVFHTIFGPFSKDGSTLYRPPDPPDLRPYNRVTDTLGVNVYPVYHHLVGLREAKLHHVGRWLTAIRRATGRNSVTMTLQICFTGSRDRQGSGDFVLPTRQQERYMIYDAIINGARGLNFYGGQFRRCHTPLDAAHGWNWTFWQTVLQGLVAEIAEGSPLHPVLLRPETTVKLRTSNEGTEAITRHDGRSLWLLAAHAGKRAETVTIGGLPAWAKVGRVYPTGERVLVENGRLRERLPGWGALVVQFTP